MSAIDFLWVMIVICGVGMLTFIGSGLWLIGLGFWELIKSRRKK